MCAKRSLGGLRRIGVLGWALACWCLAGNVAMADVVVPNQYASIDAPTSNDYAYVALGADALESSGAHYQCFISQDQLADITVGAKITGISFRLNRETYATVGPLIPELGDDIFPEYDVRLAQAATTASTFSNNFATNLLNPVLVRSGSLTVSQGAFKPNGAPGAGSASLPFYEMITFSTPYTYLGGDLVVDVGYLGGTESIGIDATPNTNSTFPYRMKMGAGVNGTDANYGEFSFPAMQFITVVPGPSSIALVGIGGLVSCRRRRKTM